MFRIKCPYSGREKSLLISRVKTNKHGWADHVLIAGWTTELLCSWEVEVGALAPRMLCSEVQYVENMSVLEAPKFSKH